MAPQHGLDPMQCIPCGQRMEIRTPTESGVAWLNLDGNPNAGIPPRAVRERGQLFAASPALHAIVAALADWWDENGGTQGPHAETLFEDTRTWRDAVHEALAGLGR
jgi:hypothetical protein